jgi:Tocopherol cyclase
MSTFTYEGTENRMRWDRRSSGFMEVWYATLNHADTGAGVWLRYTITVPQSSVGSPYCELWAFYFDPSGKASFAGKNRFPIDQLGSGNGRDDGALVRIGDSWLSETHLEGLVRAGDRELSWSFEIEPAQRCFQHLPPPIRRRAERKLSTVCSPNLSVPFTGKVVLDGESLEFSKETGCQSHRWGRAHSASWAWAHCASFESDEALLEGVAARASIGPFPFTTTLLYLSLDGRDIAFNDLKWAFRAKSHYEMPTWSFTARNETHKIVGAARARIENMFQVTYMDPDGSNRYCANSEIADLALEVFEWTGKNWRNTRSLTSTGGAHLEFGRRDPFPELPVVL